METTTLSPRTRTAPIIRLFNGSYGFGMTWTLEAYGKTFYLGQDGKVCARLLQMSPRDVAQAIGSNDLRSDKVLRKLARFILNHLEEYHALTPAKIKKLQCWDLAVE